MLMNGSGMTLAITTSSVGTACSVVCTQFKGIWGAAEMIRLPSPSRRSVAVENLYFMPGRKSPPAQSGRALFRAVSLSLWSGCFCCCSPTTAMPN